MNEYTLALKQYFQDPKSRMTLILCGIVAVLICIQSLFFNSTSSADVPPQNPYVYLADQIPEGFTLVPIQIQNSDSIASMMDITAVVDLFSSESLTRKKQLLARNVKLIKVPGHGLQFGAVLGEDNQKKVFDLTEPVFAVLKSNRAKPQKTKPKSKSPILVIPGGQL